MSMGTNSPRQSKPLAACEALGTVAVAEQPYSEWIQMDFFDPWMGSFGKCEPSSDRYTAGADPKLIAERAGHTSVAVVLDRDGHLCPDASDRLNAVLEVVGRSAAADSQRPRLVPLDVARA